MPDIKLTKPQFSQALSGKSLDVEKLKADSRMDGVGVEKADLNQDGQIAGRPEADALFKEVDEFDRDGNRNSVLLGANGNPNAPVADKIAAIGDVGDVDALRNAARLQGSAITGAQGASGATAAQGGDAKDPSSVGKAAEELIRDNGINYGTSQPWVNTDPNHAMPANVRLGGLKGSWKCNLFGGNAIQKGGFDPPYYGNRGKGEYPNANQMYKWSDAHASRYGNKVHFASQGELAPGSIPAGPQRDKAIAELLSKAQPGDLVVVDHQGSGVRDGGHVRVIVENSLDENGDGVLRAAQASYDTGEIQNEGVSDFTGEETIWVLRPNRPSNTE